VYGRGEYTFEKIDSPRVYRSGQSVSAADEPRTVDFKKFLKKIRQPAIPPPFTSHVVNFKKFENSCLGLISHN